MKIDEIRNENIKEIFEKQKNENKSNLSYFENSRNFISKQDFFSNFQKESQSENSKDETSQRNNIYYQTQNLMLS